MKRTKLVASLLMCVFCISFFVVCVYATVNVNFLFDSHIKFNPEGVYVDVSAQMYSGANYGTLTPLSGEGYSYTGSNYILVDGQPSGNFEIIWDNLPSVTLVSGNRSVKYRIEVTNVSETGIKGNITTTITGILGTPTISTTGGVKTSVYTNCTVTEYSQYVQNIQPTDTQVYELIVELNETTSSATINANISFDFTDDKMYTIEWEGDIYNYINMGRYPQRYVGDVMNTELEALLDSNDYNLAETGKVYTTFDDCNLPSSTTATNAKPILIESKEYSYIDGNTYVRIETPDFDDTSLTYMNGETVISGEPAWFKVEPIQWRVLTENYNSTGSAMLLSELALSANTSFYPTDSISYGDINNYARNDNPLRNYLTMYFYNQALTSEEQAKVQGRNFAEGELEYNGIDEEDVISTLSNQKIWIPTMADYINANYGFSTSTSSDYSRRCSPSDFAIANYASVSNRHTTLARQSGGATDYWISSSSPGKNFAYNVTAIGNMNIYTVDYENRAVRPALLFNL